MATTTFPSNEFILCLETKKWAQAVALINIIGSAIVCFFVSIYLIGAFGIVELLSKPRHGYEQSNAWWLALYELAEDSILILVSLGMLFLTFVVGVWMGFVLLVGVNQRSVNAITSWMIYKAVESVACLLVAVQLSMVIDYGVLLLGIGVTFVNTLLMLLVGSHLCDITRSKAVHCSSIKVKNNPGGTL